ncbi:MFS transporter [Microbispora sp. NPDC004025]
MTITASPPAAPARARALAGIALGYFMVLLDTTVLSVAEPGLARSFGGAGVAGLQWAVTGYTLVFGASLLTAGSVADRYGAHRVFRMAVAAFGLGSLLSAFAPSLWALVGLRALLGLAAAGCVPASMAMIARLYPVPAERARAVAVWAATSGAALVAGPVAGGALTDLAGWRAIFLINVPLAAVTLTLTLTPAVRCPRGDRRIDWAAQALACAVVALLTDTLIALGARALVHAAWSAGTTALAVCAFAVRERRGRAPVLEPAVLSVPGIPAALLAGAAVNFAMSGVLFVLPLLLQQALGLTPGGIGVALLPMTLPFAVNPLLTGRIVARSGPRPPVLAGLGLLTAGGLAFGAAVWAGASYPFLLAGLVATGFGVSFALPALATLVVTVTPAGAAGAAGGLLNAARQCGATIGVAVTGAFMTLGVPGGHSGAAYALIVPAVVCAVAAAAVARTARTPVGGGDGRSS